MSKIRVCDCCKRHKAISFIKKPNVFELICGRVWEGYYQELDICEDCWNEIGKKVRGEE